MRYAHFTTKEGMAEVVLRAIVAALVVACAKRYGKCAHGIAAAWGHDKDDDGKVIGFTVKRTCRTCRRQRAGRQIMAVDQFDYAFKHEWKRVVNEEWGYSTWVRGEIVERAIEPDPDAQPAGEHAQLFHDEAYGEAGIGMAYHTDGSVRAHRLGTFRCPELMDDMKCAGWLQFMRDGEITRNIPTRQRIKYIKADGMTQLERMVSEGGRLVSGQALYPHWNEIPVPKHLTASYVSQHLDCDGQTAQALATAFALLDLTPSTVWASLQDIKSRGIVEGATYYTYLAVEMQRVTAVSEPEMAPLDEEFDAEDEEDVAGMFDPDKPGAGFEPIGYHRLDVEDVPAWVERQREDIRTLFHKVEACQSKQEILNLGEEIHGVQMSRLAAKILWASWRLRKQAIYEGSNLKVADIAHRIRTTNTISAVRPWLGANGKKFSKLDLKYLYKELEKREPKQQQ